MNTSAAAADSFYFRKNSHEVGQMNAVADEKKVGQWVSENPHLARVFESYGIDFCCGGKRPLIEVCAEKGISFQQIVSQLKTKEPAEHEDSKCSQMSMTELVDHIIATHHAWLRTELPRLESMIKKVQQAHGDRHPKLHRLRQVFDIFQDELKAHMWKEEHILFPMIKRLDSRDVMPGSWCGSILNPIEVMEHEHDGAGQGLKEMKELTDDYTAPLDGCNTYRVLMTGLAELEVDMHRHIHKENNILFPAASRKEAELLNCGSSQKVQVSP